jgi:uncharacterized protein (TIGR02246 family)
VFRIWLIAAIFAASLGLSASAQQADQGMRQQIERLVATYADNFNKHDAAGIASLYAKDGMLVSSAAKIVKDGPQEIEQSYQNLFKTGMNHGQITVDQIFPLGTESAIYLGEYHLTGEGQSGALKVDGHYTAVAVREGNTWKIRLATAFPNPPPSASSGVASTSGSAR